MTRQPDNFMSHLAIWEAADSGAESEWGELVTGEEYLTRPAEGFRSDSVPRPQEGRVATHRNSSDEPVRRSIGNSRASMIPFFKMVRCSTTWIPISHR
jgi:hypothetical protein